MIISYLVVKRKFRTKGLYRVCQHAGHGRARHGAGRGLYPRLLPTACSTRAFCRDSTARDAILVIVFVVRSLPAGTRSGISALRQIDKSIEEIRL